MEFAKIVVKVVVLNAAAIIGVAAGLVVLDKTFDYFNDKAVTKN